MKKILTALLCLALSVSLMFGCAPAQTDTDRHATPPAATIRFASLKGPTTMGIVKLLSDAEAGEAYGYTVESEIFGTADEITGLLISGELDMASIPANLAAILYGKSEGKIVSAAINTLGVIYIVESGDTVQSIEDLKGKTIYSTGKGTTPEYALNAMLTWNGIDPLNDVTIEYKSEATEIAALMAENPDMIAVLPQPYVTSVLMQNDKVRIALDLTEEWEKASDLTLVTGVTVVNADFAAEHPEAVAAFLKDYADSVEYVNFDLDGAAALIENYGIVAKAAVAKKALPFCNIVLIEGAEMKEALSGYLGVLFEQNPQSVGGTLPDESFYYTAG